MNISHSQRFYSVVASSSVRRSGLSTACGESRHEIDCLLLEQVFSYYKQSLQTNPAMLEHLSGLVGESDMRFISDFGVGFVDRTMPLQLPHRGSVDGGVVRGAYQRYGIIKPTGHEAFRGAFVYPLFDIDGRPIGLYGYWPHIKGGKTPYLHILWDLRQVGIVNPDAIERFDEVILTHCPIETSRRYASDQVNSIAMLGELDSEEEYLRVFRRLKSKRVRVSVTKTPMGYYWATNVTRALRALDISYQTIDDA